MPIVNAIPQSINLDDYISKSDTIIGESAPTQETVGYAGQHYVYGKDVYICLGAMGNSESTKYIWNLLNTTKVYNGPLIITSSQSWDATQYGLSVGDEIIVACVSGGNGGKAGGDGGGAGGKGGKGNKTMAKKSSYSTGYGGGGAGNGYGAGGGGAGGGSNSGTVQLASDGGNGGNCQIINHKLDNLIVSVTVGAAGAANGGNGGTTSFGSYLSVTGGGGSAGGKANPNDSYVGGNGGGGGGGGGWYYIEGNLQLNNYGVGSDGLNYASVGNKSGGDGGGNPNSGGKAGNRSTLPTDGEDSTIGGGSGAVFIWY